MRNTRVAPDTFEPAVILGLGANSRAFWRGFGLIQDDIHALLELGSESIPASDAGSRATNWNMQG